MRYHVQITLLTIFVLLYGVAMFAITIWAIYSALAYHDRPCDQPLGYYLPVTFVVSRITPRVLRFLHRRSWAQDPKIALAITVAGGAPSLLVMLWGARMVNLSKTCQVTNPSLFYSTEFFIYGQMLFFVLTSLFFGVGFTALITFLSTLRDRMSPGCEAAVHKLPKVPPDSPELMDEGGGELDCPICTEPLLQENDQVVRTPCSHLFHESCLARWCKNHLDCPMCRAEVGSVDEEEEEEEEEEAAGASA